MKLSLSVQKIYDCIQNAWFVDKNERREVYFYSQSAFWAATFHYKAYNSVKSAAVHRTDNTICSLNHLQSILNLVWTGFLSIAMAAMFLTTAQSVSYILSI